MSPTAVDETPSADSLKGKSFASLDEVIAAVKRITGVTFVKARFNHQKDGKAPALFTLKCPSQGEASEAYANPDLIHSRWYLSAPPESQTQEHSLTSYLNQVITKPVPEPSASVRVAMLQSDLIGKMKSKIENMTLKQLKHFQTLIDSDELLGIRTAAPEKNTPVELSIANPERKKRKGRPSTSRRKSFVEKLTTKGKSTSSRKTISKKLKQ
jgi:hypothetical protein